jgi:hypothetical protein
VSEAAIPPLDLGRKGVAIGRTHSHELLGKADRKRISRCRSAPPQGASQSPGTSQQAANTTKWGRLGELAQPDRGRVTVREGSQAEATPLVTLCSLDLLEARLIEEFNHGRKDRLHSQESG